MLMFYHFLSMSINCLSYLTNKCIHSGTHFVRSDVFQGTAIQVARLYLTGLSSIITFRLLKDLIVSPGADMFIAHCAFSVSALHI